MSRKFQVFVSSTYQDLVHERDQVIKAVLEMGHIPVGMEMFSAADEEQWKIIARQIDEIDYYVVIVAHRYGSVTKEGISYTEKEFDYAVAKGVPILGFVIDDEIAWPADQIESDTKSRRRLGAFKAKIKNRLIQFWKSKEDLHGKVSIALMKAITANPRIGWVRADEATGPEVTKELTRLSSENARLRDELAQQAKRAADQEDEVRNAFKVLHGNNRKFRIRRGDKPKWNDAGWFEATLADIFHWSGANLLTEDTPLGLAQTVALRLVGSNYFRNYPIGINVAAEILADFAALDLVEPSKKKHPVSDKTAYWTLTAFGKKVHKEFRRILLEQGFDTSSDDEERSGDDGNGK